MNESRLPPGGPTIKLGENVGKINNLDKIKDEKGNTLWADSINAEKAKSIPKTDKTEQKGKEIKKPDLFYESKKDSPKDTQKEKQPEKPIDPNHDHDK